MSTHKFLYMAILNFVVGIVLINSGLDLMRELSTFTNGRENFTISLFNFICGIGCLYVYIAGDDNA